MAKKATQPRVYVSQRGGRKKIHKNKYVYLKNDDIFEIELENPTKDTVLAKIELNGKSLSNTGLVIRPGERFVLERFIDEDRMFKFKTYEIDGSNPDMAEAISDNGKLNVTFYKEVKVQNLCNPCVWINHQTFYDKPYWKDNTFQPYNTQFYCSTEGAAISSNVNTYSTSNFMSGTGQNFKSLGLDDIINDYVLSDKDSISLETGRVEKGNKSNQEFDYVDIDFENEISYTSEIQILPDSRKVIEKSDLNKIFCHKCGSKSKKGDKFCSKCGTELHK